NEKLKNLLERYDCEETDLPDFGYYPTDKKLEFTTYESSSVLRDSESIPLKQSIYQYFLNEVKPHVAEAWINLDSVKIGYEINFNKYFYHHKPLRELNHVSDDIIRLEQKAEGLIAQILGVSKEDLSSINKIQELGA
ncbi:TPA: SAM-dependent DNA methyltransferase, partial [Vibrio parahaemolyticus]|nr:SAM-dependent DNA methyltransferase [Vibrio parahaemolyticus]